MVFYFINDLVSSRFKESDFEPARSRYPLPSGDLPSFFYLKRQVEKFTDPGDTEKYIKILLPPKK